MSRPRHYAAALAVAAVIGAGGFTAAQLATPSTAPHTEPHRIALDLPARPLDPAGLLAADGAGSVEDVRAAACTGDPAALAAAGWTPQQLAQLPAVAAEACPTDHDPAPAAPSLPADPCALGVDQLEAAGLTEAEALTRRTPCSTADAARQLATATATPSSSSPARRTSTAAPRPAAPSSSSPAHRSTSTRTSTPARPAPAGTGLHDGMTDPATPPCAPGETFDGRTCLDPDAPPAADVMVGGDEAQP